MKRIEMFGCPIDTGSMQATVDLVVKRLEAGLFTRHVAINVAKLVTLQTDPALASSVRSCDVIGVDGMGVVWAAWMLGLGAPERVAGIDLFGRLLDEAAQRGYPVFLLGAHAAVVEEVVRRCALESPGLQIAGYHHGYFEDNERTVVEKIRLSRARLLFVAMPSPRKESFIARWRAELGVDFVMGVGGTFDVVARKVKRAAMDAADRTGVDVPAATGTTAHVEALSDNEREVRGHGRGRCFGQAGLQISAVRFSLTWRETRLAQEVFTSVVLRNPPCKDAARGYRISFGAGGGPDAPALPWSISASRGLVSMKTGCAS